MHEHSHFNPLIFMIALIVTGVFALIAYRKQKKRAAALEVVAAGLGLSFDPAYSKEMARRLGTLKELHTGYEHLARNLLRGTYRGESVIVCDYQFTIPEGKESRTEHFHVTALELPRELPTLCISPENFLDKAAAAVGFEDINFESAEFSRTFWVTGPDKKFAYDFCNARMIEYLLATPKLYVQVEGTLLAVIRRGLGRPDAVQAELDHLLQLRGLMPDYLFDPNA